MLWCDWGRSLEIGAETCAPFYRNVIFRQCDCIHVSSTAMDIQHCDFAHIHHIRYENIRVELSVTDVCFRAGFSDCSRFIIKFKAKFGLTPLRYKQALRREKRP